MNDERRENPESIDDTIGSVISAAVLSALIPLLNSKDKNVRLRGCQLVASVMQSLGEMDDELHGHLQLSLCRRILDKEVAVRTQAAVALCRLQGDVAHGSQDELPEITTSLLERLMNDPSS